MAGSNKREFPRLSRREFLSGSLLLAPATLKSVGIPRIRLTGSTEVPVQSVATELPPDGCHLTPHYLQGLPFESLLDKVQPGSDEFLTEKYAAAIEARLALWTRCLCASPPGIEALRDSLSPEFRGSSLEPGRDEVLRKGVLQVRRRKFSSDTPLGREQFIEALRTYLDGASTFLTAEFQLFSIFPEESRLKSSSVTLHTKIRYDLVSTGPQHYRQQRVGQWQMTWLIDAGSEPRVTVWQAVEEVWSLASRASFIDISARAFARVNSYSKQMLHGTDYWRTVLDAACGLEVYGNNGLAVGDVDGDGFDDLYVCQPGGLPNRLYRNSGDGIFEDITERAGVGVLDDTPSALFVDIDNDGHQELIVVTVDGPLLFSRGKGGRFELRPDGFRFEREPQGTFTSAAAADYNRDGWLDIYFCVYSYYQGLSQYQYPVPYFDAENGTPNFLFRNNGRGAFEDVTQRSGMDQNNHRYSFACAWCDYDGDGWPDLYVANDFGRKNLYHNNGDGTFTDAASKLGAEDFGAGMSVCWFDYDNNGRQDLYVGNMWTAAGMRITEQPRFMKGAPPTVRAWYRKHTMGNSLLQNAGQAGFKDVTHEAGVAMGRWAWGSDSWDADRDGYPDLYIANGMVSALKRESLSSFFWRQVVSRSPLTHAPSVPYERGWDAINELIRSDGTWSGYQRNVFYLNNRDGSFSDVSGVLGLDFPGDSRAFALADLDQDGRLEVVLKNRTAPQLQVLHNNLADAGHAISFRLRGTKSNRDGVGAIVKVNAGALEQTKSVQAGSGFLSQHTKELFFGLGEFRGPVTAMIVWPAGSEQLFQDLPINRRIQIEEGSDRVLASPFREPGTGAGYAQHSSASALGQSELIESLPATYETWLLAPLPAPAFPLRDSAGTAHRLPPMKGHPGLLSFWSVNCAESVSQLRLMKEHYARWAKIGVKIGALNVDEGYEKEDARAMARKMALPFQVIWASPEVVACYNLVHRYLLDRRLDLVTPASMLLDDQGFIVKLYQGQLNPAHVSEDCQQIPQTYETRLAKALPFRGQYFSGTPSRNLLTFAIAFFERGYLDQASATCRAILASDRTSAEAEYVVGAVFLKKGMPEEAKRCFVRVVHLPPRYADTEPNAWNNLGLIAARKGRIQEAISDFDAALRLNPNHTVALENLGNVYREIGRWNEARTLFERAIRNDPGDATAVYSLAMVYADENDSQQALRILQETLSLRPDYPPALNNLAVLLLHSARTQEAIPLLKRCVRVAPDFDQPYLNLARVYAIEGERAKAEAILRQLLARYPDHVEARQMLERLRQ
jgi:tetratricopeptide (TPR) repeat protein